jgi:hypothetical protein
LNKNSKEGSLIGEGIMKKQYSIRDKSLPEPVAPIPEL